MAQSIFSDTQRQIFINLKLNISFQNIIQLYTGTRLIRSNDKLEKKSLLAKISLLEGPIKRHC